jgi:hypothetical protein
MSSEAETSLTVASEARKQCGRKVRDPSFFGSAAATLRMTSE